MNTTSNEALVRRLVEMLNTGTDIVVLDQLFARNFVQHNPEIPPGLAGIGQYFAMLRTAFPDAQFSLDDVRSEGDRVMARVTFRGTHRGDVWGFPPTGKSVSVTSSDTWRVSDERFAEYWGGLDRQSLAAQLGIEPPPVPEGGTPPTKTE